MFVAQCKLPLPQLICENVIVTVLIGLGARGNLAGCGRCPLIMSTLAKTLFIVKKVKHRAQNQSRMCQGNGLVLET